MKFLSPSTLTVFGLVAVSEAYPNIARHVAENEVNSDGKLKKRTTFDASQQYISNQGEYAFVAPSGDDQRGPCPGLNAMANHGYLPHNGVANIPQFIQACTKVFGMGEDLATFLAIYGSIISGNGYEWSIGGPTPSVPGLAGVIGNPSGISGSHNKYESDVSPTRGDLYEYGNDYLVQMSQFKQMYEMGQPANNYDLQLLTNFRAARFQQSIENNPDFFYGPISGVIVSPAAFTFIYRFMANKSAEYPDGRLDGDVLKSFFSITGDYPNFKYTAGHEKIPDNWYTRSLADPYTIPALTIDAVSAAMQNPEFAIPGGNLGKTNTYLGLDPSNLTEGVINAGNLLENDNFFCLAYQATVQALPDILDGVLTDVEAGVDKLTGAFTSAFSTLNCPKLSNIDESQFAKYPGYAKSMSS